MDFPDVMLLVGSIGVAVLAGGVFLIRLVGAASDVPDGTEPPVPESTEG